ncbi:MAG: ferrous iron transport protein A [Proteobacteria bacterium]|nr:ferrous iron transport protein A [Pseudomonadota bacterium]MBU1742798.1 ferrous iron transport protein A [Pseudomonadota bacterium]
MRKRKRHRFGRCGRSSPGRARCPACSLRGLEPGERGVIDSLGAMGELGRRLRDMGLVPGTPIEMVGRAPLRDPVQIKVRGSNLALRNNEADHILVTRPQAEE